MKMEMFTEVGSVSFLQDDAEKKIYEKYKELYQNGKGCHYLIYEKDKVIAITSPLEPSKLTYAPDTYPYEPLYFILYQPFEYLSTTSTFVPLVNIPNLL